MQVFCASAATMVQCMYFLCKILNGVNKLGNNIYLIKNNKRVNFREYKFLVTFSLAHAGLLPKYFTGKISFLRIQVPETSGKHGGPCICAFGSDPYSVISKLIC